MSRFTMVLAAAVATAMLVIGASALDAVGADPPAKAAADTDLSGKLADCLRGRGVTVPALTGDALDRWLQTHRIPDAEGRACKQELAPEARSTGAEELAGCLRAQGLDVPADPVALKEWIGHQGSRTALGALKQCGVVMKPDPGADKKPAPCGTASSRAMGDGPPQGGARRRS